MDDDTTSGRKRRPASGRFLIRINPDLPPYVPEYPVKSVTRPLSRGLPLQGLNLPLSSNSTPQVVSSISASIVRAHSVRTMRMYPPPS